MFFSPTPSLLLPLMLVTVLGYKDFLWEHFPQKGMFSGDTQSSPLHSCFLMGTFFYDKSKDITVLCVCAMKCELMIQNVRVFILLPVNKSILTL